jgi:hypothetical protein
MRGPFAVAFALSLFALVGIEGVASAQKKAVVIEMFKGPNAPRVRAVVAKALTRSGLTVVSDKRLAAIEADLGLVRVAENYPAIARETKAIGFVAGIVTGGRRPKARVVVRNAEGKIIGGQGWQATGFGKLLLAVNGTAGPKIAGILSGGGGAARPAVAAAPKAEPAEDILAAADRKAAAAEEAAPAAEEEAPRKKRGKADEEEEPAAEGDEKGDAEAEVAAEADDEEVAPKRKAAAGTGLNIAFVLRMFSRNFAYNDNKRGLQQGYQAPEEKFNNLPIVPAPGLALEYFPATFIGGFASFNYAIIGSKDKPQAGAQASTYTTKAYSWMIGAKGRVPISTIQLEPSIGYGSHVFKVDNFAKDPTRIQVAGVDYRHIRAGGGLRLPFGTGSSFTAGGYYLHILDAGEILDEQKYFKGAALGGELFAGVTLPLSFVKGVDLTAGLDFRRITFAFTPNLTPASGRIAGGAVDQYVGLNLGLGYNLGI